MAPSAALSTARHISPAAEPARPLLTIALPTYNRARYLDRFFKHHLDAFSARGIDFEILVSDNCSTDETPDIIARWAKADARIRSVRQTENIGAYGNFLYTYRQSRGSFAIWVGDDDLLIPERIEAYLRRLAASPDIVMLQAPWLLIDETRGDAEMGTFYRMERDELFARGEHARCLDFLMTHHAFPEWFIIRTDAMADILEPGNTFVFHYFAHLARALNVGKVLFAPEPFARVTAISKGANNHTGNSETMDGWDRFRGGLEYLASFIAPDDPAAMPMSELLPRLQDFTLKRMAVAANLHISAGNWTTAYHLDRRMRAYGRDGMHPDMRPVVSGMAAIEAVIVEAQTQARGLVVLDDVIADDTLESLAPKLRAAVIRRRDPRAASTTPKAFALLQPPPPGLLGPDDIVVDLAAAFRRCPP
ncbi:MAG: glycosyltransferase family 2 protein [Phreatobacter sp.]|uniref:glycosyltransferase family 2 protein n=1 Tax=Phreatobacter sp. TaxID=1966341 RepID=UPI001A38744E|nr:glycosyltransferase family A protein [Phreatobacter sp.]MBL8570145.1 glycosyltransferase family 2 protein [Phreatobacter sp.]